MQRFACFPGDAPATITQCVAWMERQFNACQTPRSMYLSIFNSFRVIRCLSQCVSSKISIFATFMKKSSFYHTPLHSTPPLGGFPSEYRHPLWYWKTRIMPLVATRWWKNFENMFICFDVIHERDGRTDGQTLHDSIDRACIASRGKGNNFVERSTLLPICCRFNTKSTVLNSTLLPVSTGLKRPTFIPSAGKTRLRGLQTRL